MTIGGTVLYKPNLPTLMGVIALVSVVRGGVIRVLNINWLMPFLHYKWEDASMLLLTLMGVNVSVSAVQKEGEYSRVKYK